MADGSVRIDVGLDTSKAEKDLVKLKQKISKLEGELDHDSARKEGILKDLAVANAELDAAVERVNYLKGALKTTQEADKKVLLKEDLEDALASQRGWAKEAASLDSEYNRVKKRIEENTQKLAEMKEEAGQMAEAIEAAKPAERLQESLDNAKQRMTSLVKAAVGISTIAALFKKVKSSIVEAVQKFSEYDSETKQNIASLRNGLAALQASWGAAFAPILNAVAPALQTLISWLTATANAVARFLAILGGRTTYKKAIANNAALTSSLGGTAAAAKEAVAQLASFDDLDILSDSSSNGGGGGGGAADAIQTLEEAVDAFDGSFLSSLALTIKDVLFTWTDLNPEQIAEKIIAGLGLVLGAALGISLGLGAGGVLLMTLGGLAFALVADALIFEHDGQISRDEALKMIALACAGLLGGVIGFQVGLVPGALLGAAISMGIVLVLTSARMTSKTSETKESWLDKIRKFLHFPSDTEIVTFFREYVWDKGLKLAFAEVLTMITGHDFTTPTEAGESLADQIIEGLNTIKEKFSTFWNETVKPFFTAEKWIQLGKDAGNSLANGLKGIQLPKFSLSWIKSTAENSVLGKIVRSIIHVPQLSWFAKGGVFDSASIIGVGEAGKEAVVPLERNTGWINLVADQLVARLEHNDFANRLAEAFAATPMPAMAGGTTIPPQAYQGSAGNAGLEEAVLDLKNLLSSLKTDSGNETPINLYVDGKQLASTVRKYDRRFEIAQGF